MGGLGQHVRHEILRADDLAVSLAVDRHLRRRKVLHAGRSGKHHTYDAAEHESQGTNAQIEHAGDPQLAICN